MRKTIQIAIGVLALGAMTAGSWAADQSQRRAKEIACSQGSIKVKASGMMNTTVDVFDENNIAKAQLDFELVEDHREALRQLGFTTVHIKTATGETLERPL